MKKITILILIISVILFSSCIDYTKNEIISTTENPTIITGNGWSAPDYQNINTVQYDISLFKNDANGRKTYEDDTYFSNVGIDVSAFQGDIDWENVACDGMDFVMLRIGFRGYGPSGLIYEDDNFESNYDGAIKAGLKIGVYFFSQCISKAEAEQEAEFVYNHLIGKTISYPVVFDWEHVEDSTARTASVNSENVTEFAEAFCNKIDNYGLDPAIYFNCSDGYNLLNLDELSNYNFWLAEYDDTPSFYYQYSMWQYTDKGTVNGISGYVDMNISIEKK